MARHNLIFTDDARRDIEESTDYFDFQQAGLSMRFIVDLEAGFQKLVDHPQRYSYYLATKYRALALDVFSFQIIYEIINQDVVIASVRHTARRPLSD